MDEDDLAGIVDDGEDEPQNLYTTVDQFVEGFLVVVYARPSGSMPMPQRWCAKWWDHAEAVSRLESLWKAFETLRQDPGTGTAVWWRDYADPTMAALGDSNGPFERCHTEEHHVHPDLPTVSVPKGWGLSA